MAFLGVWKKLEQALSETYDTLHLDNHLAQDVSYLKRAYFKTERLWAKNFSRIKSVNVVMLSEAPLFGSKETYFYNPDAGLTSFFQLNDAKAILGDDFADQLMYDDDRVKKAYLLQELAGSGFVVLDLFPFALNESDTGLTYRNLPAKAYQALFQSISDIYFKPKLEEILRKGSPIFLFRYGRLQKLLNKLVREQLQSTVMRDKIPDRIIPSIHGRTFSLSQDKLRFVYSRLAMKYRGPEYSRNENADFHLRPVQRQLRDKRLNSMKPVLRMKSEESDQFLNRLVVCITDIEYCSKYFSDHLGKSQSKQAVLVNDFSQALHGTLTERFPSMTWTLEHVLDTPSRDSIDIFGRRGRTLVVIELDKTRADQVAKKFVSRSAMFKNDSIYYISFCYPGTKRMNSTECIKYFRYCADLSKRMGNLYAGFVVETL